jgi:hypothetical protein
MSRPSLALLNRVRNFASDCRSFSRDANRLA